MGSKIEIQSRDKRNGFWSNIELSKVRTEFDEIVVGKTFRILVDGESVYVAGVDA